MDNLMLLGNGMALATAVLWTFNAMLFTSAGKRLGAVALNAIRITLALMFFIVTHLIFFGTVVPSGTQEQITIMLISGMLGLAVGDFFYFSSLLMLGPRRASLIMAAWPIFAALLAYFFLGETLSWLVIVGMVLTTAGVTWVIIEKKPKQDELKSNNVPDLKKDRKALLLGVVFAIAGAFCQAIGYVYGKRGMTMDGGISPLTATFLRMIGAFLLVWIIVLVAGYAPNVKRAIKDNKGLGFALGGTVTGPFLGVWASMGAALYTKIGIASTLMSLTPVFIIPLVWIIYKEKVSPRSIIGAVVAVVGIALLFLA